MYKVKKNMLVADNSELSRIVLKEIFGDDFCVFEAKDGAEALGVLSRIRIDVALIDTSEETLDAFGFMKELKAENLFGKFPVIALKFAPDERDTDLCTIEFGVDDVLLKPCPNVVARKRVENVMDAFEYRKQKKLIENPQ